MWNYGGSQLKFCSRSAKLAGLTAPFDSKDLGSVKVANFDGSGSLNLNFRVGIVSGLCSSKSRVMWASQSVVPRENRRNFVKVFYVVRRIQCDSRSRAPN